MASKGVFLISTCWDLVKKADRRFGNGFQQDVVYFLGCSQSSTSKRECPTRSPCHAEVRFSNDSFDCGTPTRDTDCKRFVCTLI